MQHELTSKMILLKRQLYSFLPFYPHILVGIGSYFTVSETKSKTELHNLHFTVSFRSFSLYVNAEKVDHDNKSKIEIKSFF